MSIQNNEEWTEFDDFKELFGEARDAIQYYLERNKEYISQEIKEYIETNELSYVRDLIDNLPEVVALRDFVEPNKELQYEIRDKFNGEIDYKEPEITALEFAMEEIDFIQELKNSLKQSSPSIR